MIRRIPAAIAAVLFSLVFAATAVADDYPTCKDTDTVLRHHARMTLLAEQGYEPAQQRVAEFDQQLYAVCLCKQTEWERLDADYKTDLVRASDGRSRPVRLAKPVVLYQPRPECAAPTPRTWPDPKPEVAEVKVPVDEQPPK